MLRNVPEQFLNHFKPSFIQNHIEFKADFETMLIINWLAVHRVSHRTINRKNTNGLEYNKI